ncbi:hypothetical protein BS47DRAFT_1291472, partial [Hydnum rufescens UP504]
CTCNSANKAAVQLVQYGLFPSALLHPTLAVNIGMLEFVAGLFVYLAPNEQAWTNTLSCFLKK